MDVQVKKTITISLDEAELKALQNILDETDRDEIYEDSESLYDGLKAVLRNCLRKD